MLTADTVLALLRSTIFHPVASLLLPVLLVFLDPEKAILKAISGQDVQQVVRSVSPQLMVCLCCVGFSWILQLNRYLSRLALNPVETGTYDWNEEVVVITGGTLLSIFAQLKVGTHTSDRNYLTSNP